MTDLHLHRWGPAGPVQVLALHGLTGHGRSSWSAPWTFDANVAALAGVVENQADGPVVVVGTAFVMCYLEAYSQFEFQLFMVGL